MSLIRLPSKSWGLLPSIGSESEQSIFSPIESTLWKCRRQVIGSLIILLGTFSLGNVFGWSTVAIKRLRDENVIMFNESLLTSLFIIGALMSEPLAAYSMLKLGRKKSTFGFGAIQVLAWSLFVVARFISSHSALAAAAMLYIGRFFTGFAGSACFTIGPVYIREICDDKQRPFMGSLVPLTLCGGNLFAYVVGGIVKSWFVLSVFCFCITPFLVILIIFIPESPQWLLTMQRPKDAEKAFRWYAAGFPEEEQDRLFKRFQRGVELLQTQAENNQVQDSEKKLREERGKVKILSRPVLRPLIISVVLISIQQSSGANFVITYSGDVQEVAKEFFSPDVGIIVTGATFFLFVAIATFSVDRFGRRPVLLISTTLMGLMNIALGTFFVLYEFTTSVQSVTWITIVCSLIFASAYAFGLGSVSWLVVAEINHPDFQELSGTTATSTYWIAAFVSTLLFPLFRDKGCSECPKICLFFLDSVICIFGVIFIYTFVLETKGKTSEEIMAYYKGPQYALENDIFEGPLNAEMSLGSIGPKPKGKAHSDFGSDVMSPDGSVGDITTLLEPNDDDL